MADEAFKCKHTAVQEYYDQQVNSYYYKLYPRELNYLQVNCRVYDKQWDNYQANPRAELKKWLDNALTDIQVKLGDVYSPSRCCAISWEGGNTEAYNPRHMIFMGRNALQKVPYEEIKETAVFQDGTQEVHITWKVKPQKVKEVKHVEA